MSMATKECKNLSKKMREDVCYNIMSFGVGSNMNKYDVDPIILIFYSGFQGKWR